MTRNQIEYQKLLETKRSNMVGEALTQSLNTANISAKQMELGEAHRANLARESETARHNLATEQHALAQLGLSTDTLKETIRSNVERERETARSNRAKEYETHRSNVAKESETERSNIARETETHRANVSSENIQRTKTTADTLIRKEANRIARSNTGIQQQLANIQADDLARRQLETDSLISLRSAQASNASASTYKLIRDAAIAKEGLSLQQEDQTRKWVETNLHVIDDMVGYGKDLITAIRDVANASGSAIAAKILQWLA